VRLQRRFSPGAAATPLPPWARIADLLALLLLAVAIGVARTGGSRFDIGITISVRSWQRLVYLAIALLAIRHVFVPRPAIYRHLFASAARNRPVLAALLIPFAVYMAIVWHGYDGGPYLRGDCIYYYRTAISLIRDGDLDLSNQFRDRDLTQFSDQFAFTTDLRPVPKHPIPLAIASAPFIGLFGEPGALAFNLLQVAGLLVVLYRLAARVATTAAAAAAVALTGVFSVLPHYVYNYSPDVFSALLLACAVLALPTGASRHPIARSVLAGFMIAATIVSKYALILFAPGMLVLLYSRNSDRGTPGAPRDPAVVTPRPRLASRISCVIALGIGTAIPLAAFMALNAHLFGSPFTTPYDRLARIGHDGSFQLYSARSMFTLNPLIGAYGQIFDRVHGLLLSSPITLPSLAGLFLLARRDRVLAWYLGLSSLAVFVLYSTYGQWNASHYGNRFLMAVVVLAALPLATLLDKAGELFVNIFHSAESAEGAEVLGKGRSPG
jgi:hypothetical protein